MLSVAFVPTADFEVLDRGPTHNFVVGRRGAGKSALFLELETRFTRKPQVLVLSIKPDEPHVKGLVAALRERLPPQSNYDRVRSVARALWRSVLLAHVGKLIIARHELDQTTELKTWVGACTWLADNPVLSARQAVVELPEIPDADSIVFEIAKRTRFDELERGVRGRRPGPC